MSYFLSVILKLLCNQDVQIGLSHDNACGNDITPCNKKDKPLHVVVTDLVT